MTSPSYILDSQPLEDPINNADDMKDEVRYVIYTNYPFTHRSKVYTLWLGPSDHREIIFLCTDMKKISLILGAWPSSLLIKK